MSECHRLEQHLLLRDCSIRSFLMSNWFCPSKLRCSIIRTFVKHDTAAGHGRQILYFVQKVHSQLVSGLVIWCKHCSNTTWSPWSPWVCYCCCRWESWWRVSCAGTWSPSSCRHHYPLCYDSMTTTWLGTSPSCGWSGPACCGCAAPPPPPPRSAGHRAARRGACRSRQPATRGDVIQSGHQPWLLSPGSSWRGSLCAGCWPPSPGPGGSAAWPPAAAGQPRPGWRGCRSLCVSAGRAPPSRCCSPPPRCLWPRSPRSCRRCDPEEAPRRTTESRTRVCVSGEILAGCGRADTAAAGDRKPPPPLHCTGGTLPGIDWGLFYLVRSVGGGIGSELGETGGNHQQPSFWFPKLCG